MKPTREEVQAQVNVVDAACAAVQATRQQHSEIQAALKQVCAWLSDYIEPKQEETEND